MEQKFLLTYNNKNYEWFETFDELTDFLDLNKDISINDILKIDNAEDMFDNNVGIQCDRCRYLLNNQCRKVSKSCQTIGVCWMEKEYN